MYASRGGGFFAEWMEWVEPRGARIVAVDPSWALMSVDQIRWAMASAKPATGPIRSVHFWLWARTSADRDDDKEILRRTWPNGDGFSNAPAEFRANSDPEPVSIAGLAREGAEDRHSILNGRSEEAIVLSASDRASVLLVSRAPRWRSRFRSTVLAHSHPQSAFNGIARRGFPVGHWRKSRCGTDPARTVRLLAASG